MIPDLRRLDDAGPAGEMTDTVSPGPRDLGLIYAGLDDGILVILPEIGHQSILSEAFLVLENELTVDIIVIPDFIGF